MRDKLADGTLESCRTVDFEAADVQFLKGQVQKKDSEHAKMERKYEDLIRALHAELRAVKTELAATSQEIARLNAGRMAIHHDYERQLSRLNSNSMKRRRRSQENVQSYIENIKAEWCESLENLTQKQLKSKLTALQDHYEEQLEALKVEHELELSQKEDESRAEIESLKQQLLQATSVSRIPQPSFMRVKGK